MSNPMVLDLGATPSAPASGATSGARARGRTEATAGSFEDVLRELDRFEPPHSQDRPPDRLAEGEARRGSDGGATPAAGADEATAEDARGSVDPEAERAGEPGEAAVGARTATPPAPAAWPGTPADGGWWAGTVPVAGAASLTVVAPDAGPGTAAPGLPPAQPMPEANGSVGLGAVMPARTAEVAGAVPETATLEPAAVLLEGDVPISSTGLQVEGRAAGRTSGAGEADQGAVQPLLQTLAGKTSRDVAAAVTGQTPGQAASAGNALSAEGSRPGAAETRPLAGEGGSAAPADSEVGARVAPAGSWVGRHAVPTHTRSEGWVAPSPSGVEGRGAGTAGTSETVPLSQLLQETGLAGPDRGATPSPGREGASAPSPADSRTVGPEGMIQAQAADGPALSEPPAGGTAPQGAAVSVVHAEPPTPVHQEGAAHPARQGAALASTPMAQVGDVVLKRLQQLRSPGSDELRLELEPKELGSLKIRLEVQGDGVKAQFLVDRPVVQAMLERAMAELRQNLLQQGYRVDELQVALQDDGQAQRQAGEQGRKAGSHHGRGLRGAETVVPELEVPRWVSWAGSGRIDVRV